MHIIKNLPLIAVLLRFVLVLQIFFQYQIYCDDRLARKSLEIGLGPIISIGGSPPEENPDPPPQRGYCPTSPPEPIHSYESKRIKIVYPVIQEFKKKVTHDPFGITNTWVGPDICNKYKGFFCDTAPDLNQTAIAGIDFNGYNFAGPELTLSGFLDQLPDIAIFHANSNNFTGVVPKSIANLRFLYELDLSNNVFTGEFPIELLGGTNLSFLDLRFNKFSGVLPPQVFLLGLDILFINNNNFMQKLPDTLGSGKFYYLSLANNNLSGSIPSSIGDLKDTLVEILLLNNQLSGCLPCEIGLLRHLTLFDTSQNNFTGPIPASFSCLGHLELLNLAQNQLSGAIPDSLCLLPKLANLSLSDNYFTKVGPLCKILIWRKVIDVRMNCIPGLPGQRSAADCHAFFSKHKCCSDGEKCKIWIPCGAQPHQQLSAAAVPRSYRALAPQVRP
ncbi:hypothetical protein ACET3Z_003373 [Daucus carota]